MTVSELINILGAMPQDATVYAEGEAADKVTLEYGGIVRIFKAWDVDIVLGSAGLEANDDQGRSNRDS